MHRIETHAAMPQIKTRIKTYLAGRPAVLTGLMGAGKTTIGRHMARSLGLPFCDADREIEIAANMRITDIFADYGETEFRILERKIIRRLVGGGGVIALGGGAFASEPTRALIKSSGVSLWLKADIDILLARALRRKIRPLLQTENPRRTLRRLMAKRYPYYAHADITLPNGHNKREATVREGLKLLDAYLRGQAEFAQSGQKQIDC